MRFRPLTLVLLVNVLAACTRERPSVAVELATVEIMASASGPVLMDSAAYAAVTDSGPYPGFDTSEYPGERAMRAWRATGEFDWVGFYLPAPCHKDTSWSGTRETLEAMGWGTAVIYVGQQTWGRRPKSTHRTGAPTTCSGDLLGAARGRLDAADAIEQTEAEGFPRGTMIFLDLEYMPSVPESMREYYSAWAEGLLKDGRYRPGFYAHNSNAVFIYEDIQALFDRYGKKSRPVFWIAGGENFSRDKSPEDVGHRFAAVWQGMLDIVEHQAGIRLPIDVNVGALPSPSSHQFIAEH